MRLLLDTHTLFWSVVDEVQLSSMANAALADKRNEVYASLVSAWEMAIKVGLGKWPEAKPMLDNFESEMATAKFQLLSISLNHARAAGLMQSPHRDPFDRLLAAQAQIEGLTLVTADAKAQSLVEALGAKWLW